MDRKKEKEKVKVQLEQTKPDHTNFCCT